MTTLSTFNEVVILGAGGLGRETLQHVQDAQAAGWTVKVLGFFDDKPDALVGHSLDLPVLGPLTAEVPSGAGVIIGVGEPATRRALRVQCEERGLQLVTVVHPSAQVTPSARLGPGCIVGPGVYVGVESRVAANVLLNVYSSVGHDATVGADAVLSSYTAVAGGAAMGECCFTGTHVTIAPGVSVGARSKVAAGSVVMRDSLDGSLLVGNPAKGRVMFKAQPPLQSHGGGR